MTPLRRRMIEDKTLRNFTPQTIQAYVRCVARIALYFRTFPEQLGAEQIRAYLFHLVQELHVSFSYYKLTRCALRFLTVTPHHARLASGCRPRFAGRIPRPAGSRCEVSEFGG